MNFGKFNKKQMFTGAPKGIEEYKDLETLYTEYGPDKVFCIRGLYINTKSNFSPEAPTALLSDCYVNLPQHQLSDVKAIMADSAAVSAINQGQAGFRIEEYHQIRYNKECYKAVWCNYVPGDDFSSEPEDLV